MAKSVLNGDKTYSKTPFKESKHKRGKGGTFSKKSHTEEDDVAYHYKFKRSSHPRGKDGAFNSSDSGKLGRSRYGK